MPLVRLPVCILFEPRMCLYSSKIPIFAKIENTELLFMSFDNNGENFELIAKTFEGLEDVLAGELQRLGAHDIRKGRRMVSFTGDKRLMYKANFALRTAVKILKPIKHFEAKNADEVYEAVKDVRWEDYLDESGSFAVDSVTFGEEFTHSKFVSYRVKDAIADYYREKSGKRPSVKISSPDLQLNMHIAGTSCTLSLDSSGESLHRRGYRQEAVEAPLNEVLAAGMIMMTGWDGQCDLVDPMCGSGTILIEAAMIARNIAPGLFRKEYAFEKWRDFEPELFEEIYNDDSEERDFEHKIYGYDISRKAIEISTANIKAARLHKDIAVAQKALEDFDWTGGKAIMITNPPYGERLTSPDLSGLYATLGEKLKHKFSGNEAWVLSYRDECFDRIGLKATEKIHLYNGALECQFRKYVIFNGKYKDFKSTEDNAGTLPERPAGRNDAKPERTPYRRDRRTTDAGEGQRRLGRERKSYKEYGKKNNKKQ